MVDPRSHDLIKRRRTPSLEQRLAIATYPFARDDIVSLMDLIEHRSEHLRGVLHVAIHHHHNVSGDAIQSRGDRSLLPKISTELDQLDPAVGLGTLADDPVGSIGAAVIDQNDFVVIGKFHQGFRQRIQQIRKDFVFVIHR